MKLHPMMMVIFKTQSKIKDKIFAKIVNGWKPLTIFMENLILNIWLGSEYSTDGSLSMHFFLLRKTVKMS